VHYQIKLLNYLQYTCSLITLLIGIWRPDKQTVGIPMGTTCAYKFADLIILIIILGHLRILARQTEKPWYSIRCLWVEFLHWSIVKEFQKARL